MKATTIRNLSAALVCIFVFALLILVGGILYYYRTGFENAQNIVESFSISEPDFNGFDVSLGLPEQFIRKLDELLSLNENIGGVSVAVDNKLVYAKPIPSQFFVLNGGGEPAITARPPLVRLFTSQYNTGTGSSVVISAAIYIANPAAIVKSAWIALVMIATATIAAIILILYIKKHPMREIQEKTAENEDMPESDADDPEVLGEIETSVESDTSYLEKTNAVFEKVFDQEPNDGEESRRSDFYAPETGFMREAFIERVLDPALIYAASHNEDAALIIIRIPGLGRNSRAAVEICECILEQFGSKERIFEYQTDGFAVIMQNTGAGAALGEAETLFLNLTEKTSALEPVPVIGIGISTKTFRTAVTAARLVTEAQQAASRALENPDTPIVALKINPEKYQEYMKQNGNQ
ncbi:MAG: hypothetical protein LBS64_00215 [Spirochaetaceae bacterium]|jgi:GGDEF domain-containing protein|nr:hypothetical protein [Spirochaetaceae bacterium]